MAKYYTTTNCGYCNKSFQSINNCQHHCSLECRFWDKVNIKGPDECWLWQAGKMPDGYGCFWMNNKNITTHRTVWELTYGPIPDGLLVCHHCDTPLCVNPKHLFLGTQKDNSTDMVLKGRSLKGEANPFSKLNKNDIKAIRNLLLKGETYKMIAKKFNISTSPVYRIKHGKGWVHVR